MAKKTQNTQPIEADRKDKEPDWAAIFEVAAELAAAKGDAKNAREFREMYEAEREKAKGGDSVSADEEEDKG